MAYSDQMQKVLYTLLLVIFSIAITIAQSNILDTRVNYRAVNRDMSNVLVDISKKSSVNIVFKISDIPEKNINFYSPDYNLKQILDFLIKDTGLVYEVVDNQIIVFKPGNEKKEKFRIKGYTIDSKTGEKLIYTNVYLEDMSKGTVSNEHGFYSLELVKGKNKLIFSYLGYHKYYLEINVEKELDITVKLIPEGPRELNEILITDRRKFDKRVEFYEPDLVRVDRIEKMVHLMGEDDIIRLNQLQSGVLSGADGFGGLHVRGGSSGDNMIILDGVPIYQSQHALGLFSTFNSSLIKNSTLYKGNFPARYGGNLSSVLDIYTRDGNNQKFRGEIDLGILTAKALVEGPIVKDKAGFILSIRRTYIDIWRNPLSQLISNELEKKKFNYYFYDLNFKINTQLNDRNNLFISFYRGGDNFVNHTDRYLNAENDTLKGISNDTWIWNTTLLSAQWNWQPGNKLFFNNTLYFSKFDMKSDIVNANLISKLPTLYSYEGKIFDNRIQEYGLRSECQIYMNSGDFRLGYNLLYRNSKPFVYFIDRSLENIKEQSPDLTMIRSQIDIYENHGLEHRAYIEDKFNISRKTTFIFGVHAALMNYKNDVYFSLEPRADFRQKISDKSILSFALSKMSQSLHTLSNNSLGLPTEMILPSTINLKPEEIWHYNLGFESVIGKYMKLKTDIYYKEAENVVSFKEGSYFVISQNTAWETNIPQGKAKMYGIETHFELNHRKFTTWFNYTYAYSLRSFKSILNGEWFEYRFSRRHMLNIVIDLKISDKMNFYIDNVFGSGNPYTLPTQLTPDNQLIYEEINNWKLPYYHRVDIGIDTRFAGNGLEHEIKFGIYNLLNRKNPYYMIFNSTNRELLSSDFTYIYIFPFLPSVSYKINF